jgi:hypothetical protein
MGRPALAANHGGKLGKHISKPEYLYSKITLANNIEQIERHIQKDGALFVK